MRREVRLEIHKLGAREYLQGGTLFNAMLEACDSVWGPAWLTDASITSYKLIRESLASGRFVVSDEPLENLNANAALVGRTGQSRIFVYFVDEGLTTGRIPYDEEQYYRPLRVGDDFSGEFVLPAHKSRADVIRGIVGANKLTHQKASCFGAKPKNVRFLYLKDLDAVCLRAYDEEFQVRITNLTVQKHGPDLRTINRVCITASSFTSEFRICYSAGD
jgi:hypothetical protein